MDGIGDTKFGSKVAVSIGAAVVVFAVDPIAVVVACFIVAVVSVGVAVDCDGGYIGFDFDSYYFIRNDCNIELKMIKNA